MFENLYGDLLNKVSDGNQCAILTYLDLKSDRNGFIAEKILLTRSDIEKKSFSLNDDIYREISFSLNTGKLRTISIDENKAILIEPFFPNPRLIVFGGGHISKPVTEFAARVGFSVTVIDDRTSFANKARFPEADKVICEGFEKSFDLMELRKSDFVVIVTRGHKQDGVVLRQVLKHELSYIGMIGSKRRVRGMMEELLEEGYSKEKLDSVNSPIGIDIGAITPDEIAISIVSQLIGFKNETTVNDSGEKFTLPEFDIEVAEKMSEKSSRLRALITILSSKGSVPRKAGAKMLLYSDGTTIGSIGGGCSEAAVKTKAREVMHEKGFAIEHADMTADVAESEGMVCGGTMEVLIEVF